MKVKNWVNGGNGETFTGITARFGGILPSDAKKGLRLSAVFSNPLNSCSTSSSKVLLLSLLCILFSHLSVIIM